MYVLIINIQNLTQLFLLFDQAFLSQSQMTVCNKGVFLFDGDASALIVAIVLGSLVGLYLLVRTCRLCHSAFSYSNFHIHETYKFYTLSLLSLGFSIFYHKVQLDLIYKREDQSQAIVEGFQIMIEILGIISIYFTRLLYGLNGILWILITLGCDYTPESELTMSRIHDDGDYIEKKNKVRKIIQRAKTLIMYGLFPALIIFTGIGVLKQQGAWCSAAQACLIVSSVVTLALFAGGLGLFLYKRRKDETIKKKTKITVIYLLVAISFREIYLLVTQIAQTAIFQNEAFVIVYNILNILAPIVALSILSQNQLQRQKCALLKSSEVMLFKTIVT